MKRLLTALAFVLASFAANAQEMPKHKNPKPTKDENVLDVTKNHGTFITYQTPAELQTKFDKEAALKMWSAEQKAKEAESIPAGGSLTLTIGRLSIESADTRWFTIVVQDEAGKETFRKELDRSVANATHGGGLTVWNNLALVYLPAPLKTGYRVFVIDAISKKRHEYLINN